MGFRDLFPLVSSADAVTPFTLHVGGTPLPPLRLLSFHRDHRVHLPADV